MAASTRSSLPDLRGDDIRTPMITDFLSEDQQQRLLEQIPVGRFCEPEEVAHGVSFLGSPFSGFITGEITDINGGLHMD